MSENEPNQRYQPSRRSVLRKGALVASLGTVGLPALTDTAVATNDCPKSPGYWMGHWDEYLGERVDIPPAGTLTKAEIRSILGARPAGDTVTIMAKHYVATYLNLVQRRDPDPECANREVPVEFVGTVEWEQVKNAAQRWLRLKGWDGNPHSGHRTWSPSVPVEGVDRTVEGEALKDALDAFNNAAFGLLDCDCDDEERDVTEESTETCTGDSAEGQSKEKDCFEGGADTSWYPPDPPEYDLRPDGANRGLTRQRVGRGGGRNHLRRIR